MGVLLATILWMDKWISPVGIGGLSWLPTLIQLGLHLSQVRVVDYVHIEKHGSFGSLSRDKLYGFYLWKGG